MKQKKNSSQYRCSILLTAVSLFGVCACSSSPPPEPVEIHRIARRQLPPDDVYNRLRWVHVPDTIPNYDRSFKQERPMMLPVVQLELQQASLEEAAAILASTARYSSYCASTIATKKISMRSLGTIDELAGHIADQAGIRVVVDHSNRQVRFFDRSLEGPRFFEGNDEASHEYQSTN